MFLWFLSSWLLALGWFLWFLFLLWLLTLAWFLALAWFLVLLWFLGWFSFRLLKDLAGDELFTLECHNLDTLGREFRVIPDGVEHKSVPSRESWVSASSQFGSSLVDRDLVVFDGEFERDFRELEFPCSRESFLEEGN